jgi:S1-C subfamily serine protease
MNTAIYSTSGQSSGVGFAVPVDTLKVVANGIIRYGKLERPATGMQLVGGNQARVLYNVKRGLVVTAVAPNSNAETAGFRPTTRSFFSVTVGDVIVECNGKRVDSEADFLQSIDLSQPGDVIELRVVRNSGKESQLRKPAEVSMRLKLQKAAEVTLFK